MGRSTEFIAESLARCARVCADQFRSLPRRFALSVAIAPVFDRFVDFVRTKASSITGREVNKAVAFAIVVFLANLVGTCSYLALGLATATRIAGVPLLPPKVA